jgi:hypothetical protein
MGRIVSADPVTKKAVKFHEGQDQGAEYWVEETQDMSAIADLNKNEYASYRKATAKHTEFWGSLRSHPSGHLGGFDAERHRPGRQGASQVAG